MILLLGSTILLFIHICIYTLTNLIMGSQKDTYLFVTKELVTTWMLSDKLHVERSTQSRIHVTSLLMSVITVIFLSLRTDRSWQTVQTQIRVYTVCNYLCIFWMHCSNEMFNFEGDYNKFLGIRIFKKFTGPASDSVSSLAVVPNNNTAERSASRGHEQCCITM